MSTRDTRAKILETAEFLIRTRGYSAFSFADLAQSAEITKASVHYHFPSKESLSLVLVEEYLARLRRMLEEIRQHHPTAGTRLRAYGNLFLAGFDKGMLPFCAAMSAERSALPLSLHSPIRKFFQLQLEWIVDVLEDGRDDGSIRPDVSPEKIAPLILSVLEGSILVGWGLQERQPILTALEGIFASFAHPSHQDAAERR